MKPKIFIGSSSESLSIAKRIKEFFDADFGPLLKALGAVKSEHI